jgi:mRNA-degrading endonuclease toxin of MazEF toxin-antitoxin module
MPKQHTDGGHSCERGYRPVVVVSSHIGNKTSDIVMVCPITTKIKRRSCNVEIGWTHNGKPSQVLCNQVMTMPKSEFVHQQGYVTLKEQKQIDIALCISLGINIDYNDIRDYKLKEKRV